MFVIEIVKHTFFPTLATTAVQKVRYNYLERENFALCNAELKKSLDTLQIPHFKRALPAPIIHDTSP